MTNTVAFSKCNNYEEENICSCVKKLFDLVPPPDVKGKVVLIKPNILSPKKPEAAVCTNPVVVGAAVKCFAELGAKEVIVGESPAVTPSLYSAKATNMLSQVEKNGGHWVDFSDSENLEIPDGIMAKKVSVASQFFKADIIVSCAKLKTHQLMYYTGAMKNLFGFMVGLSKAKQHYVFPNKNDFGEFITDLNIAIKADYAIMDAVVAMEGPGGPGNGEPVSLNFLAASDNLLALDWKCAELVGYNPYNIPNLNSALKRKKWLNAPEEIQTAGTPLSEIKPKSFKIVQEASAAITLRRMLPKWLDNIANFILVKNPHFTKGSKCIRCGKCIEICPPKTLKFSSGEKSSKKRYVTIDRDKCIHCYCCHEICPADAIKLW
jgi:uncharacterized protein (DUF362 family)/NAD-dependent dihydropyrimidine dehydrogenase PreA subunit